MSKAGRWRFSSLPLGVQMIGIVVCTLVIAQVTTLALTLLLPPSPPPRWAIAEVAEGLLHPDAAGKRLERTVLAGPPDLSGDGWLVSPATRSQLARRLRRRDDEVVLAFYTALPVGGVAIPAESHGRVASGPLPGLTASLLIPSAQAQMLPGGPPMGGPGPGPGLPGGGFPGGGFPGGGLPGGGLPGGRTSGNAPPSGGDPAQPGLAGPSGAPRTTSPVAAGSGPGPATGAGPLPPGGGPTGAVPAAALAGAQPLRAPGSASLAPAPPSLPARSPAPPASASQEALVRAAPTDIDATVQPLANAAAPPTRAPAVNAPVAPVAFQPIPFRRQTGGILGLVSPPFIEGDFVAGMRQPDGRWVVVAPRAEGFPNRWQRRVALWFLLSLAMVGPVAWLFARRIVRPLQGFAHAAETLGRDPSATIMPLLGPAEIGRAARAFNQMRARLRAFVDDRTAVVGAISHDLRTPLTRLRFRIENVPDDQRDGLLKEVVEMEEMITQVIAYIRDASTPGPRQARDMLQLVRDSIEGARVTGSDVSLAGEGVYPVEVDPVGIRRVLGNLIENAVKYGNCARIRVHVQEDSIVAEIRDDGPGIPESERERVFEPFYRGDWAARSGLPGSGLGLAVCRSIARAHGGEVSFRTDPEGFVTALTMPRLIDDGRSLAA